MTERGSDPLPPLRGGPRRIALIACAVTGAAVLAAELIAFRALAPHFGSSIYTAGIIINAVLAGLALGYAVGGLAADRLGGRRLPYLLMLAAASCLAIFLVSQHVLLPLAAGLGPIAGAAAAAVGFLVPPMIALGAVPPCLVRALASPERIGAVSGMIFAVSTVGSIAGGVATTFWLIPYLGVRATGAISVLLLLLTAGLGLWRGARPRDAALALPCLLLLLPAAPAQALYEVDSRYNHIAVLERDGTRYLMLNQPDGFHSMSLDPDTGLTGEYYDAALLAAVLIGAEDVLILGNGAGTAMRLIAAHTGARIDGVELDPELTRAGQAFFDLQLDARRRVFHEDARSWLARSDRRYDLIFLDVYAGSPFIPFHLATEESFALIREHLAPGGALVMNLPSYAGGSELLKRLLATVGAALPARYVTGHMLLAFREPPELPELGARLQAHPLGAALTPLAAGMQRVPALDAPPLTDDRSPIEALEARALSGP